MSAPERPNSVPAEAEWNPSENEWELGPKNEDGEPIGDWSWWAPEGNLVCKASYDDHGQLHGLLERWHPNGERAQWATWVHGKTHGMQVWTLATEGPSDKSSHLPPNVPDDVKRMDMPYYHGDAQPYHFTLYYTSGLTNEVPTDDAGRSIDLGDHIDRVAPDSTLLLVEDSVTTTDGDEITWPDNPDARWVYKGPAADACEIRLIDGYETTEFAVSRDELTRAFSLSATHYIAWRESRKPDSVPDGSIWSIRESNWLYGETNDAGKRVGQWKWWDQAGTLRREAHFSKHGAFDGEFKEWHPDGSPSLQGVYENGTKTGVWTHWRSENETDRHFPGGDGVWRYEYDEHSETARHFNQDGVETNGRGVPLTEAYDDDFWRDKSPETFLEDGFEQFLDRWIGDENPAPWLDNYAEVFEDTWGFAPPPQLAKYAAMLARYGRFMAYELRADIYPDVAPDIDDIETDNLFERLVIFGQNGYLDTSLHEAFSGLALVGTLGNGDSYMVSVLESHIYDDTENGQLYFFSHDDMAVDDPFATDLSHLVYASCLADTWSDYEAVSDEMFREAWAKLDGHIAPSWHWGSIMEAGAGEQFQNLEPEHQTSRYHFWCSYWIIQLLRDFDGLDEVEVTDRFWLNYDNPRDELIEKAANKAAIGLNLLWRAFFFDDEEFLVDMLAACKDSKSRLIRDSAALIERFRAGDRTLGEIEDIYEVRDAFIALDLHPDRAAEREAEAAEAERLAAERAEAAATKVAQLAADGADLEDVFWNSFDNPELQVAIRDHWKEDPSLEQFWSALDDSTMNKGGFGTYYVDDAFRWVAGHPDGRITGMFVAGMRDRSFIGYREMLPSLDWSRGFDQLIPLLDEPEEFNHIRMAITKTLGEHRVEAGVDGIIGALHDALANDRYGMSKDFQIIAIRALGQIGGEKATAFINDAIEGRKFPAEALAPAAAELGAGQHALLFAQSLDDEASAPVLWALAELAPSAPAADRASILEILEGLEDLKIVPMMLAKHAIVAYGGDFGDLRRWVRSALARETNPYSADTGIEQCVWAMRVAAEHDQLEPEIILDWIDHDTPDVAAAAQAAADKRGLEFDVRRIDQWQALELFESGGLEALHEALADPTLIHMHAVANVIAEEGDASSAPLVVERIKTFIESWREVSSGGDTPRLLKGLFGVLRELGDDEALVEASLACFEHGHGKIVDPVLRAPVPQEARLREHMEATAGTTGGWKKSAAEAWLAGG